MALGTMQYDEILGSAEGLDSAANAAHDAFDRLRSEMNSLEEVLKSKGGESLYQTYKTLDAKICGSGSIDDGFTGKVGGFADFLRKRVDEEKANDASLNNQVNG